MQYYNSINKDNYALINMDKKKIKRIIVSCAVECKGSIEDIQAHIENIYDIHISEGSISNILTEDAEKAKIFNDSILLDKIKIGVSDEIFQAGNPVLVGVEPSSTYVYLMEPSSKRDPVSWWAAYCEKQENQGLKLEASVTDGGLGMKKGIREVYENITEQYDIFHMLMKFTKAINIYENKVYGLINVEYNYQKKLFKAKPKITIEYYEKANLKASIAIERYDIIKILIMWMQELFNFGGYSSEDKSNLIDFLLDELNHIDIKSNYLDEAIKTLSSNKEALLAFTKKAEKLFLELSNEENIRIDTLNLF